MGVVLLKKFNLKKAKKGHAVVKGNGEDTKLVYFDKEGEYPLIGVSGPQHFTYTNDGIFNTDRPNSCMNLFMKEEKKVKKHAWMNVYKTGRVLHNTKESAEGLCGNDGKTVKITWKE